MEFHVLKLNIIRLDSAITFYNSIYSKLKTDHAHREALETFQSNSMSWVHGQKCLYVELNNGT